MKQRREPVDLHGTALFLCGPACLRMAILAVSVLSGVVADVVLGGYLRRRRWRNVGLDD